MDIGDIDKAMNYFCDLLDDTAGIRSIRPAKGTNTTKGGWYYPHFKYVAEELEGLSLSRFSEAVRAEGSICNPGCNKPLHLHPLFTTMDVYGHGRPTRIAYLDESVKIEQYIEQLPVAEAEPVAVPEEALADDETPVAEAPEVEAEPVAQTVEESFEELIDQFTEVLDIDEFEDEVEIDQEEKAKRERKKENPGLLNTILISLFLIL